MQKNTKCIRSNSKHYYMKYKLIYIALNIMRIKKIKTIYAEKFLFCYLHVISFWWDIKMCVCHSKNRLKSLVWLGGAVRVYVWVCFSASAVGCVLFIFQYTFTYTTHIIYSYWRLEYCVITDCVDYNRTNIVPLRIHCIFTNMYVCI